MKRIGKRVSCFAFLLLLMIFSLPIRAKTPEVIMNRKNYSFAYVSEVVKQVDKMTFLTGEEKEAIKEEAKLTMPHYNKIAVFENKIKKISDRMMKTARPFNKKYDTIYSANKKLWPILEDEFKNSTADKKLTRLTMLKKSVKLSEEEKKRLADDAKELDSLDAEISKIHKRIDKSTANLKQLIEKEWMELDKIYEKSVDLWEKIIEKFEGK